MRGGLDRDRLEQLLADPGQSGGQRLVLRLEGFALLRGHQGERGAVLDAEFVERLCDVQPHPVGPVQLVPGARLQAAETAALELVVEELDDVVKENLDWHGCGVDLRNQVLTTYDRNRATGRK